MFYLLFAFGQFAVFSNNDLIAIHRCDLAAFFRNHNSARVASNPVFKAGGHERRFGHEQRHGLALHV